MTVEEILNRIEVICDDCRDDINNVVLCKSFVEDINTEKSNLNIVIDCKDQEIFDIISDRIYDEIETSRKINLY